MNKVYYYYYPTETKAAKMRYRRNNKLINMEEGISGKKFKRRKTKKHVFDLCCVCALKYHNFL